MSANTNLPISSSPLTAATQLEIMRHAIILAGRISRYGDSFSGNVQLYTYFFDNIYPLVRTSEKKQAAATDILKYALERESLNPVDAFSRLTPHKTFIVCYKPHIIKKEGRLDKLLYKQLKAHNIIFQNIVSKERFLSIFRRYSSPQIQEYIQSSRQECKILYEKVLIEEVMNNHSETVSFSLPSKNSAPIATIAPVKRVPQKI